MNSSINPYQPPVATTAVNGDSACLRFDGVITQEDYRRLLPGGDVERWLFVLLAILLSIVIVFMGMATFYVMMNAGNFVPGLVMLFGIESPGLTASLAIGDAVAAVYARS